MSGKRTAKRKLRIIKERRTIEIKDIDEITKKEDDYDALRKIAGLEDISKTDVFALRRAFGRTQTAPTNQTRSETGPA